jgi:hypothetical protein
MPLPMLTCSKNCDMYFVTSAWLNTSFPEDNAELHTACLRSKAPVLMKTLSPTSLATSHRPPRITCVRGVEGHTKDTTTRMTWKARKPSIQGYGILQWTSPTAAYWGMYSKGRNEWIIWEVLTKCNRTPPITQDNLCSCTCTFILCNINILITSGRSLNTG